MNVSLERPILLHQKLLLNPNHAGSNEPLDLSQPLDLSKKGSKPTVPAAPQQHVPNGRPRSVRYVHERRDSRDNLCEVTSSTATPLRSTKYPLQRGLVYVQPRSASISRNGGTRDIQLHDPAVRKSSQLETAVSPEAQAMMNYAAMQQRVRTEAANIAAMQAQATNAAQEAVRQAMARHEAASLARARKEALEAAANKNKVAQRPHHSDALFDSERKKFQTDCMSSVKPTQRKLSQSDIRAYAVERQLAQLSAMREIQCDPDLIRLYREMMSPSKTSSVFVNHSHTRPEPEQSNAPVIREERSLKKQISEASETHSARGYEAKRNQYIAQQQRYIDSQIATKKRSEIAVQFRQTEHEFMKHQQELIMRQQQQLVIDANNNRRRLEFARNERDRKNMMAEFSKKQLDKRMEMREELARKQDSQTVHSGYLTLAAYTAARSDRNREHVFQSMPRSTTTGVSVPGDDERSSSVSSAGERITIQHNSLETEKRTSSKLYSPTKRTLPSLHDEAVPKKIKALSQGLSHDPRGQQIFNAALNEIKQSVPAQKMLYNTYDGIASKKLSGLPVRERLLMARMSKRDRHDLMVSQLFEKQALRVHEAEYRKSLSNIKQPTKNTLPDADGKANSDLSHSVDNSAPNHHALITPHVKLYDSVLSAGSGKNEQARPESFPQAKFISQQSETALQRQPSMKRASRLPSYEDALAAQRPAPSGDYSNYSVVARRLVSSSQDWFKKNYLSRGVESQGDSTLEQVKVDKRVLTEADLSFQEAKPVNDNVVKLPVIESAKPTSDQLTAKTTTGQVDCSVGNNIKKPSTTPSTPPILDALGLSGRVHYEGNKKTVENDPVTQSAIDLKKSFGQHFSDINLTQTQGHSEVRRPFPETKSSQRLKTVPIESLPKISGVEAEKLKVPEPTRDKEPGLAMVSSCDPIPNQSKGSKRAEAENDLMQADTASLGREERALQRAILRLNVSERHTRGKNPAEAPPVHEDTSKTSSNSTKVHRRKRRKLSRFQKRARGRRPKSTVTNGKVLQFGRKRGRPRRSALSQTVEMSSLMRTKFQDFIPTVLDRRTRNSGSAYRVRNYRSMYDARNIRYELEIEKERAKVMERRRRAQESNIVENASAMETDDTAHGEKNNTQPMKRPRGRPRTKPRDEKGDVIPEKKVPQPSKDEVGTPAPSPEKEELPRTRPLRVVLDQNTPNQIKMKFLNLRSISNDDVGKPEKEEEKKEESPPTPRRRGRPPKTAGKCKYIRKSVARPNSPEPPKLEPVMPPCEDKENESDYEDFVQDPDYDSINPELTIPEYARVIRPDPPPEMKRSPLNKTLGETLLHRASSQGNMEILSYCIDYRVIDVNARDNAGYTALHDSCVEGHLHIAQFLLSHGADVNATAADGTRPIHDAVDNDRVELVRLLLAYGADPFLATNTGRSITKLALSKSSEMKTLLFGYLQDVNGDRLKHEDAPKDTSDYQWSFNGSCSVLDTNHCPETSIFADVPGPEEKMKMESGEDDEGVFFEMSDKPALPSYNLRLDGDHKFRNWVLMSDVTQRLSLTNQQILRYHPDLEPVTIPASQFNQSAQESQIACSTAERVNPEVKGQDVTLLELNDGLRSLLDVEVQYSR